jgi:tRNA A-37 threonylcarbamoyl transferase component Bud32
VLFEDVGILPSVAVERGQLVFAEGMILAFLIAGYLLGRWARHTSAMAIAELRDAMRVIGDQQQALAEVQDEQARQNRVNEGRWTGQTMGSFKLGLVLGRGAMGEVYEAMAADGRVAAVKRLNQRTTDSAGHVERFHREMAVAARLLSPYIVRVYELSPPDAPVPYIAMERLFGTDLATRLRAEPRLPSDELVVLLDQVARGLEVARRAGVVHRDLKPHNLFFHAGATWKVLDFGVSKLEAEPARAGAARRRGRARRGDGEGAAAAVPVGAGVRRGAPRPPGGAAGRAAGRAAGGAARAAERVDAVSERRRGGAARADGGG